MSLLYVDDIRGKTTAATVKMPAGTVIQVVEGSSTTQNSTTSTTVVDSGLTATITPKFSTSKILATASIPHHCVEEPGTDVQAYLFLKRLISGGSDTELCSVVIGDHTGNASRSDAWSSVQLQCLDSPGTTTSTTFRVQHRTGNSGWTSKCMNASNRGSIVLMEISQ